MICAACCCAAAVVPHLTLRAPPAPIPSPSPATFEMRAENKKNALFCIVNCGIQEGGFQED